jgi:C-terminal processing protease CtpA/Prc
MSLKIGTMTQRPVFTRCEGKRATLLLFLPALVACLLWANNAVGVSPVADVDDTQTDNATIEPLAQFARLYGYVRFFHPSDEAAAIDWDRFAVLGAREMLACDSPEQTRKTLERIFGPVAPTVVIGSETDVTPRNLPNANRRATRLTYWEHFGVKLVDRPSPYRCRRVIQGSSAEAKKPTLGDVEIESALLKIPLGGNLVAWMPIALPADESGRTTDSFSPEFEALRKRIDACDFANADLSDPAARVAGVVIVWNVFQHFHPYHDEAAADWELRLRPAIKAALDAATPGDYLDELCRMIAPLQDGHGIVWAELGEQVRRVHENPATSGGLAIRVRVIDRQITVTGVPEESPFERGDVIVGVDGVPALQVLEKRERLVSGSPQLRQFRALNNFGQGPIGSTMSVEIVRGGVHQALEVSLEKDRRTLFGTPFTEIELPDLAELAPGVFYVNLTALTLEDFSKKLPEIAKARGVIFDQRWDGRARKQGGFIDMVRDVIPHLTSEPVHTAPFLVPQITKPDRAGWTWSTSGWDVKPEAPRIKGRVLFIHEPSVVSYGETCAAMLDHYNLAEFVGEPTAGCNGNVNFIPLPGGATMIWTGMKVLKHDNSQLYIDGYRPLHPVERTLADVVAGRDSMIAQAVEAITAEFSPAH